MANNKMLKKVHSTPGIYFSEVELNFAPKSLGITRLGVAGETQKGPAFQAIPVEDWGVFQTYFGGTSTELFRGSQYPKYELPYIAKEYLKESQQLFVTRVLGLSGVNAGAAWCITAYNSDSSKQSSYTSEKPILIAVLRSRGEHVKAMFKQAADPQKGICEDVYEYDGIKYYAKDVKIAKSKTLTFNDTCNPTFDAKTGNLTINSNNYGMFTLVVTTDEGIEKKYAVSLNPGDKNYIINVLGQDPEVGDSEIFVEEFYDIALEQLIERGEIDTLANIGSGDDATADLVTYPEIRIIPSHKPVEGLLTMDESMLLRKHVGKRYLYSRSESVNTLLNTGLKVHVSSDNGKTWSAQTGEVGHIYTVVAHTLPDGTRKYYYGEYTGEDVEALSAEHQVDDNKVFADAVEVKEDNLIYVMKSNVDSNGNDVVPLTLDINNYKEQYRFASTPWVVSEMKGSATEVELTKLFRFHTISDGNTANTEVKVSIENIDPENGTFDVLVRDFNDSDTAITTLEKYSKCDLIPGSPNYIAYLIGSVDESYQTKSKFITVEVNETDKTKISIPGGFMGYPVRYYDGYAITGKYTTDGKFVEEQKSINKPYLEYNTNVREDLRINKQYFGVSDLVGIDADVFKYKGIEAYNELPGSLTPCFHLDARIFSGKPNDNGYVLPPYQGGTATGQKVTVDGIYGYEWITVGAGNTLEEFGIEPRLGEESTMLGTIYEDKRARKFTMCFYGGWDGWDYYRTSRSTSDDFIYRKYRGEVNHTSGIGYSVDVLRNEEAYGFERGMKCLTSDFYAYLSAIRTFANPKTIEINHLATPGIDYVNDNLLVHEVIDMVEQERGDSVYVVTTPDKPYGASDDEMDMYTPTDAVDNLDESEIDCNYVCSSYPWNKHFDTSNNQYIYLPPTKDMVRNFAFTDRIKHPWYAAVGWNRGHVNAIGPKKSLKLGEQDELYNGRLNFTNTFAQDGLRLWGDKNFQKRESPMNRISHRRALNRIKVLLNKGCVGLVFDPNDPSMGKTVEGTIAPILKKIKENKGLVDFKIKIDDSEEARDRLEINANLFLKLMPNLEYINITLTVLPSGMQISEV